MSDMARFPAENECEHCKTVEREGQALGHYVGKYLRLGSETACREDSCDPEHRSPAKQKFPGGRNGQHGEREKQRMDNKHWRGIDIARRLITMPLVALDAAGNGFRKAAIELHRRQYQGGIQWHEEHAGRRRRDRAVVSIENAVAEDAMAVEIVGDGEIKRLIEIAQPLLRL